MNGYPIFFKLNENVYYIIEKKLILAPSNSPFIYNNNIITNFCSWDKKKMIIFHVYIALNVSPANQHTIGSDQVKTRTVNVLWIDSVGLQARGRPAVIGRDLCRVYWSQRPAAGSKKKKKSSR